MIAGPPARPLPVPAAVRALAGRHSARPVWVNEFGGITFAFADRFVKWAPLDAGLDPAPEVERLRWAARFTPVPRVVEVGADHHGSWMVTEALPGTSAVDTQWLADPAVAVRGIGEGLRALHDALPVDECPFDWSAGSRVADADAREHDPARWHDDHRHLDIARALRMLRDVPEVDRLVVAHGDACAPNTLLGDDGRWVAHVDLGALGVADRWADLAVAAWSTEWNYGPGWEGELLAAYGVDPDPPRTAYYRLLWDLGP